MRIYVASDHAGFALRSVIAASLRDAGHEVLDKGDAQPDPLDDYPDFIFPAARAVAADPQSRGIILGGSGEGEAIAANRTPGIRAVVYYGPSAHTTTGGQTDPLEIIRLSREHNDANILSLGARFLSEEEAVAAVTLWLNTPFSGDERHIRRIQKLDQL